MSRLFSPFKLGPVTLDNRIVVPPLAQYSAIDGKPTDWHMMHVGAFGISGAGLVILEATAVEERGRATHNCLGIYTDEMEQALGDLLNRVKKFSSCKYGIQLWHSGRKASRHRPPRQSVPLGPTEGAWPIVGPSAEPFAEGWNVPHELDEKDMPGIIQAFGQAAERCARIGFDVMELHSAHGYLMSSFLSPLANKRKDKYGGSLENRMRFPLAIARAARDAWPKDRAYGLRINGTDWIEGGITIEEAVEYSARLRDIGADFIDVSSGSNGFAKIPTSPGYQVPLARRIKAETGMPTMAVGLITTPELAEETLESGAADLICIGRGMMKDPRWPWRAAEHFGVEIDKPYQYVRPT
jgi:2,4-dienoyl-CoA reductase-like NADH-dependent reductase (Old Yellow Enzyme family)